MGATTGHASGEPVSSIDAIPVTAEVVTGNVAPQDGTVIDLQCLPLAPGEEERIEEVLGQGEVRAEIDALGPTIIQETSYPGVWLVTHRNTEQAVVGRFIEVTHIPELLKSQQADIENGANRLENELKN